jgi:hypothetical protein
MTHAGNLMLQRMSEQWQANELYTVREVVIATVEVITAHTQSAVVYLDMMVVPSACAQQIRYV